MARMNRYISDAVCPICQSERKTIVVQREQLAFEHDFVQGFFRQAFVPDSPEYMFKDHIYFTHLYDADLTRCQTCGHIRRTPRLSAKAVLNEYSEDTYHPNWLEASYQPYCNSFLEIMPRIIKIVGENAYVLELGSQVGGFLHAATAFGWKAVGVDVGRDMVNFSRSKGFSVFEGTLEDAKYETKLFDAVFVWLCFEMLPSPQTTLQEIFRILRPGGYLFVSVPNGEFIRLIQPMRRLQRPRIFREYLLKVLAYSILAAFPFQFGYTASSLNYLLTQGNFVNIQVKNQLYVPISSQAQLLAHVIKEKEKLICLTHHIAQFIYYASMRKLIGGPWIEVICQKPL